jgi:cell division transport system permease protein
MLVSEALRSLRASASTTLAATMTVLIGMFLLGVLIALGTWVVSWSDHVKKEVIVKVYFTQDASAGQINAVAAKLDRDPRVKKYTFVSKEEALERMKKRFPDLFRAGTLPSNPLPASEEVEPKKAEYADAIYRSFFPHPTGVENVNYGKKTAKRILRVAHVIELVFVVAVLILLAAAMLLIANTIRLSIFSRRREIEVMKLVGATNWFVRGPFMLEGLFCGLAGSLLAVLFMILGKTVALPAILPHLTGDADVKALAFPVTALILVAMGLSLGAIGSGLTIRRFLRI